MIQIDNEYEIPLESNYYQNNDYYLQNYFEKRNHSKEIIDYSEQKLTGSSSLNNIYHHSSNEIQLPKEKIWTIPLLLESPKSKNFR